MKKIALVVVLLFSALAWAGTVPNPADYTINVHVSGSRIGERGQLRLQATIDGKKYELEGDLGFGLLLLPGDYKAKALAVSAAPPAYDVNGVYEFLFPDNKTKKFSLVGVSE
jgi:hypothetical protein